jgi:predicted DsbA family dithiol-disulfide isomerase|tara:strand:- start:1413 stop:1604 length:192 start_codon:yes stop_codon:yes gene_type:complete
MSRININNILQEIAKKKSLKYNVYRKKATSQHWTQKLIADMKTRLSTRDFLEWEKRFNEQLGK